MKFSWLAFVVVLVTTVCIMSSCAPTDFSIGVSQPATLKSDPQNIEIVFSDVENFWSAYDAGATAKDFENIYFGKASNGLKDFVRVRKQSVNPTKIAEVVRNKPRYFASIRPNTLSSPRIRTRVRELFAKFKAIFPEAQFADVYLMMGSLATGGTIANNSILIGTEIFARSPDTPTDELNAWEKSVTKQVDDLPTIISHELIHIEQAYLGMRVGNTLLGKSLQEGGADFVSQLFTGTIVTTQLHIYGEPRQKELWKEFVQVMNGTDIGKWLYNGANTTASGGRPADMGYYIGYKIVESYYNTSIDKQKAIREIMEIKDPTAFLYQSGYNP
jgi:hypothetical protein